MKKLLATSLVLVFAAALGQTVHAPLAAATPYVEQDVKRLEEAALALGYRARVVIDTSVDLSSTVSDDNLRKATRLSRQIQILALSMAEQLKNNGDAQQVLQQLTETESLVLQLDAAKRALESDYSQERDLIDALNGVRRTYFYLKQLLTGEVGRSRHR